MARMVDHLWNLNAKHETVDCLALISGSFKMYIIIIYKSIKTF